MMKRTFKDRFEDFCIRTIRYHDAVVRALALWSFTGSAGVLLLPLIGIITIEQSLTVILLYGFSMMLILVGFHITRRDILLGITDPERRERAHLEMLAFLANRKDRLKKKHIKRLRQRDK